MLCAQAKHTQEAVVLYARALGADAGDVAARAKLAAASLALDRPAEAAEAALLVSRGLPASTAPALLLRMRLTRSERARMRRGRRIRGAAGAERDLAASSPRAPLDPCGARVPRLPTGGALLARHVHHGNHYLQYPFGNTEARPAAPRAELERGAAAAGGPVQVLYVGVGDVRNPLRTCEEARAGTGGREPRAGAGHAPSTPLELALHLCDIDRCILARDPDSVLLLVAAGMGEPSEPTPANALFLWRLWFCLDMPAPECARLDALLSAPSSPPQPRPAPGPPPLWQYWLSPHSYLPSLELAEARVQRHSHDLRVSRMLLAGQGDAGAGNALRTNDPKLGFRGSIRRSLAALLSSASVQRELEDWFRCLSISADDGTDTDTGPRLLSPTLVTPPAGLCPVHHGLQSFRVFPADELAAHADAAAPADSLRLVPAPPASARDALAEPPPRALSRAATRRLARAAASFAAAVAAGRVSVALYPADGLQLCVEGASAGGAETLPAAHRFDFIDCSNLADNEGARARFCLAIALGWLIIIGEGKNTSPVPVPWAQPYPKSHFPDLLKTRAARYVLQAHPKGIPKPCLPVPSDQRVTQEQAPTPGTKTGPGTHRVQIYGPNQFEVVARIMLDIPYCKSEAGRERGRVGGRRAR
eukprot:tig00001160_g7342.t1